MKQWRLEVASLPSACVGLFLPSKEFLFSVKRATETFLTPFTKYWNTRILYIYSHTSSDSRWYGNFFQPPAQALVCNYAIADISDFCEDLFPKIWINTESGLRWSGTCSCLPTHGGPIPGGPASPTQLTVPPSCSSNDFCWGLYRDSASVSASSMCPVWRALSGTTGTPAFAWQCQTSPIWRYTPQQVHKHMSDKPCHIRRFAARQVHKLILQTIQHW